MNVIIITPCSRPDNLPEILKSINFPCRWIIVHDMFPFVDQRIFPNISWIKEYSLVSSLKNKITCGKEQVNFALDLISFYHSDAFVYVLDDDNIIHPDFYKNINVPYSWIHTCHIFGQQLPDGSLRIPEFNKIIPGHIDQAQFLLHTSVIGANRYAENSYEADGHFIYSIVKELPNNAIKIYPQILSYYNFLKK
jgi:hypothetical protein